jgi:hypothetical protein
MDFCRVLNDLKIGMQRGLEVRWQQRVAYNLLEGKLKTV